MSGGAVLIPCPPLQPQGRPRLLFVTVITLHVLAAGILCLFILLHAGRGGGLSDMFGGGMSLGGSTVAEKNLDRLTVFAATMFMVTTISLGFLIKDRDATPPVTPPVSTGLPTGIPTGLQTGLPTGFPPGGFTPPPPTGNPSPGS